MDKTVICNNTDKTQVQSQTSTPPTQPQKASEPVNEKKKKKSGAGAAVAAGVAGAVVGGAAGVAVGSSDQFQEFMNGETADAATADAAVAEQEQDTEKEPQEQPHSHRSEEPAIAQNQETPNDPTDGEPGDEPSDPGIAGFEPKSHVTAEPNDNQEPRIVPAEPEPLTVSVDEEKIYGAVDIDGDGLSDAVFLDADNDGNLDLAIDTTGDGQFDTLQHNVKITDEGMSSDYAEKINDIEVIPTSIEPDTLVLSEDEVIDVADLDGDGLVDAALIDADGNEVLDMALDTTGDGQLDSVFHDVVVDENGEVAYETVHEVGDIEVVTSDGEITPLTDVLKPDNMASNLFDEESDVLMEEDPSFDGYTDEFGSGIEDMDISMDMNDMI